MAEGGKPESQFITDLRKKLLKGRQEEFVAKSVEHQVKKDLIQFYNESNQQKQKILKEEKQNLQKMRDATYKLENDFCESVWKFSREHDFAKFLVNYPRVKKPPPCDCEFYKEDMKTIEKALEENAEIQKVTREVETLRLEFETLYKKKSLQEEIRKASEELKFASEEDAEIQRLTKVLQNSQQELEFLQSKIENFQKDEILYIDSSPEVKKKRKAHQEITSKKTNSIKKPPQVNKNSSVTYPNTIDNYLILKGNKVTPSEEKASKPESATEVKKLNEFQTGSHLQNRNKSGVLNSWSRTNPDNFPFTDLQNSIKGTYTFLESSKRFPVKEILYETAMKPDSDDLKKSLVTEQKTISRTFTPKKKSSISEKLLKKH